MNKFKFSTVISLEWKKFFLEFFDKEVATYANCSDCESSAHKLHAFYFIL